MIGVSKSEDKGQTWEHVGVALAADYDLSAPWVTWDAASNQFVMIPNTHSSGDMAINMYATSPGAFPMGWKLLKQPMHGDEFMGATGIHFRGEWWMFATVRAHSAASWNTSTWKTSTRKKDGAQSSLTSACSAQHCTGQVTPALAQFVHPRHDVVRDAGETGGRAGSV